MDNPARHPYFTALFEAAKAVHSSLNPEDVLQQVVRSSADALGVRAASLRLLDRDARMLVLAAHHGLSRTYLEKGPVSRGGSDIDRRALAGETVVVLDAPNDARFQYRAAAAEEGFRSVLCVPVQIDGQGIGVLRVYSDELRPFDQGEVELLTAMATLGGIAIRNAEQFGRVRNDLQNLEQFVTAAY
jgi:signal transduction protein with GAF and PtsI domain